MGTCPKGQAQHCLVHGVFETEIWNDLEVVGGMKGVGYITSRKKLMDSLLDVCKHRLELVQPNKAAVFAVYLQH